MQGKFLSCCAVAGHKLGCLIHDANAVVLAFQVWDLRMLKELNTYRGAHTRDVACAVWHPVHEELFSSGSQDGSLVYWLVSRPDPQARLCMAIVCTASET